MIQNEVDAIRAGFEQASARMQQISDFVVTTKAQIMENARLALEEANAFAEQLRAAGNITPEDINVGEVDTGTISGTGASSQIPMVGYPDTTKEESLQDLLSRTTTLPTMLNNWG
jgi:hypothetical protein